MRTAFSILVAVVAFASVARADAGTNHVTVDLLADTTAVQAGKPFTLGVRFRIDPGWHIYWTNPGDSGLPTRVKLDLPATYKAGEVQYPVPSILKLPGDIINYAYEREVMLLIPVNPVADAKNERIAVHVDYLVCAENCLPGSGDALLDLPSGAAAEANGKLFAQWRSKLPSTAPRGLSAEYTRKPAPADSSFHVQVRWPADVASSVREVQWLPPALSGFDMEGVTVATRGGVTSIDFKLTQTGKDVRPDRVDGLIVYSRADGSRVGFPLPIYPSLKPGSPRTDVVGSGS